MGYHTFSHNDGVIDLSEAKNNSIMIFDDVACEKQDNTRSYICIGRHKNIDPFFYVEHIVIYRNIWFVTMPTLL